MKTRDLILDAARRLFNAGSVARTSLGQIAVELDISGGNLHYHFQTREQIVSALVRRFAVGMAPLAEAHQSVQALDDFWRVLERGFEGIDRYRFVHRDSEYLVQEYPPLRPRLERIMSGYLALMRRICAKMAQRGALRASPEEIEAIALQLVLNGTGWPAFASLALPHEPRAATAGYAAYHTLALLSPYVDAAGRAYLGFLREKYRR